MSRGPAQRRLRVLTTRGGDDLSANPYLSILASHGDAIMDVQEFSWSKAFWGRWDVLHLHWPEALVRSPSRVKHLGKLALLWLLVRLDRVRRRAHVSTIHNLRPHEAGSAFERGVLRGWLGSCQVRVYLSQAGLRDAGDARGVVIPHGDYADYVRRYLPGGPAQAGEATVGRVLLFGMLRRYKGIERLIEAFGTIDPALGLELVIAGKAIDADYERRLAALATGRAGVSVSADRFLGHTELLELIAGSELVVLPYERMYNSGAALMALTVGRPVAATGSPSMAELGAEFGDDWVRLLPAELSGDALAGAVLALRARPRSARPDWSGRTWDAIAAAHRDAYRRAIEVAHGAGRRSR